ncbi:uncharacterized protein LOC108734827 isoform X2 [Agrilus planipennis]|uniref:Uncharacterized protein LOC108734827 isoform X2 n=1 Tax=Agrilus planipennis TaxID=224129 RepID=A0A1W4WPQ9_AGRPL|nr:uncharacterized protein LOC108734827 isoform X2 [Agrilus planipennis]
MKLIILSSFWLVLYSFWFTGCKGGKWYGKWFPYPPGAEVTSPVDKKPGYKGRVPMGIKNSNCDDGKTNLTVDWDKSADSYLCFYENLKDYMPDLYVQPILQCDHIPRGYMPEHYCMHTSIVYRDDVPTFGGHRPLWPRYGEYQYLPPQRWLHSLEHGAIVMLYHPCADPQEINKLKGIVTNCLYRHIITPYNKLQSQRPFALVTWGCKLMMSKVDHKIAKEFIMTSALQGPEKVSTDGQFDYALLRHAKILTDENDSTICPEI